MRKLVTRWSAAVAAVAVTAAGCSDDDGSSAAFCDGMAGVEADVAELAAGEAADLDEVATALGQVDPPDEIAEAYRAVVTAYAEVGESGSLTDPASQMGLVDVQDDLAAVSKFVAEECRSD